jgi:ferrous iron transport protein B
MDSLLPPGLIKSLVVSGIINGVGSVFSFVPLIMFMFFAIAFLEDTGYLARVAYMLDRVFRTFGLHGSSVMAYIVSGGIAGGCAVPGVMATRTLRSPRERLATLLTAPFMNCGAKLPVFAMLIAAFFPARHAQMMFLLTLLSWAVALFMARIIRWTILRGPSTPFLLELPPYRMPTVKGLLIHTWERTWQYIRKAGTIILALSVLFWALMTFPRLPESEQQLFEARRQQLSSPVPRDARGESPEDHSADGGNPVQERLLEIEQEEALATLKNSYAGRIGMAIEGLSLWCGFEWRTNVALLAGFAAKELIISTLGTAYSIGQSDQEQEVTLSERLKNDPHWSRLKAFSLIVFIMLYAPCLATVTCIAKEAGKLQWALFSICFNTSVAFALAAMIYQGGRWLGLGG